MKVFFMIAILCSALTGLNCSAKSDTHSPLVTENFVDVAQYMGKWYAISAMPQFFTRKCLGQTAEYKVIDAKTISVLNTCLKKKNKVTTISGKAVVLNTSSNAELEVTFDNFFTKLFRAKGDYNIIKLDVDYKYVLVGTKDRKSLWIMSRQSTMPKDVYAEYVQAAKDQGFPVSKIVLSTF